MDALAVALAVALIQVQAQFGKMGAIKKEEEQWHHGQAKSITFIVTKDCQLACKYCYLVGKNSKERMPYEIAKQAVDYILDNKEISETADSVVCDYIKTEMFKKNHPWFNSYRFSFSTNGINYNTPKVQDYIKKNHSHLSIAITIDGSKKKHDLNRVYKSTNRGSYNDVVKNIPLWLNEFPEVGTKVTISSADIPYIKDSVLHLYSLGIHIVNINCVFEDIWHSGDDILYENQLIDLANVIIDEGWYHDYYCSFFI